MSNEEQHFEHLEIDNKIGRQDEQFIVKTNPKISFLRKFYLVLFVQWLFVIGSLFLFHKSLSFDDIFSSDKYICFIFSIILAIIMLFTFFFRNIVYKFPINLTFYIIFVVVLSLLVTFVGSINFELTLCVSFNFASIALALTLYAFTTKCDITYQGAILYILGAICCILEVFLFYSNLSEKKIILVAILGTLFGFYVIYDTQSIISGIKYDWSKDDWLAGTINLYMDVFVLMMRFCELLKNLIVKERN